MTPSTPLRVPLFVSALLLIVPFRLPAQGSFTQGSMLGDTAYVEQRIKNISDEDLFNALRLESSDLKSLERSVRKKEYDSAYRAWSRYWTEKNKPQYVTQNYLLLLDNDLLMEYEQLRTYALEYPEEQDTILSRANTILQNRIRVWGNVVVEFGTTVDFNREIGQSGKYGFHYWIWARPLNAAWVLTGEERYLAKFDELFNRWYEQRNTISGGFPELNVVYYELGLGIRNRMFIENYLTPYARRPWKTDERMLKTILGAARWLYELETKDGYRPGNWQSHGCYMLAQIAMVFTEFKEAASWLEIALQRIEEHRTRDFFEDGGHSERSPRNYTMATYLTYRNLYYLLHAYGESPEFGRRIRSSLGKTIDWWLAMITPLGETPAINDSHRGLFPAYVLQDGAEFFEKPEVYGVVRNLLGISREGPSPLPQFTSRHMPASGFTVMRSDWTQQARYLSLSYGKFAGFHTHNDMFSFELYAYGRALAVDAGIGMTYDDPLYIPWYQSSRAHNMIVVNDQNLERKEIEGENIVWRSLSTLDYFAGEHRGYAKFGILHRRHVAFVKSSYWVILDRLTCEQSGDTVSWYLHSPTELVKKGNGFVSRRSPGLMVVPSQADLITRTGKGMAASTDDPLPGRTQEINWITFDQTSRAGTSSQFAVLLYPFHSKVPDVAFSSPSNESAVVRRGGTTDYLYFPQGPYRDEELATDAVFLLRHDQTGKNVFSIVEGTYLRFRGKQIWSSKNRSSTDSIVVE